SDRERGSWRGCRAAKRSACLTVPCEKRGGGGTMRFLELYFLVYNWSLRHSTWVDRPRRGRTGDEPASLSFRSLSLFPRVCPCARAMRATRCRSPLSSTRGRGRSVLRWEAVMMTEKSVRRMPLRQLLTHSEKYTRDLIAPLRASLLPYLTEYRELSRPVRRRSSYPSMITMHNALRKVQRATDETREMIEYLQSRLEEIVE